MRRSRFRTWCLVGAALLLAGGRAAAQELTAADPARTPGWVITPSFGFSSAWDDNVTLAGHRAQTASDGISVFTPSFDGQYRGRYNLLSLGYTGAFTLYRQLDQLNSFDQQARIDTQHRLSRRLTVFLHDGLAVMPTTDLVQLSGIPFLRTGSRVNDGKAELHAAVGSHTTASGGYTFEWVGFDPNNPYAQFLKGGKAHGFFGNVQQQVMRHLSVGGEYSFRRALVANGGGQFDIMGAAGTWLYQPRENLLVTGALGFSRLTDATRGTSQIGPSWRLSGAQRLNRATVDVGYIRSYVPSFGLGGTVQNEEFNASFHMPVSRNRLYWQAGISWRRNDPLTFGESRLRSLWLQTSLGYSIQRWLRLEGFYGRSQQDSQLAGGRVDRNRLGVQIVTTRPVRIR